MEFGIPGEIVFWSSQKEIHIPYQMKFNWKKVPAFTMDTQKIK